MGTEQHGASDGAFPTHLIAAQVCSDELCVCHGIGDVLNAIGGMR